MIKAIEAALSIIDKLIPGAEKRRAQALLKEDQELQKAIQSGDVRKIEEIRMRKKKYGSLFSLLVFFCLFGCGTLKPQPPILGDNIPVRLKIGSTVIEETGKVIVVETNKNTLVSDAYIYKSVTAPDEKKK